MILDELAELTRNRIERQKRIYSFDNIKRDAEMLAASEMEVQEFDYPFEEGSFKEGFLSYLKLRRHLLLRA